MVESPDERSERVTRENREARDRADTFEFKPRTERPRPAYVVLARDRARDPTKANPDRWVEQVTVYDRATAELWAASIATEHPQLATRIVPVRGSRRARPHPRRLYR